LSTIYLKTPVATTLLCFSV